MIGQMTASAPRKRLVSAAPSLPHSDVAPSHLLNIHHTITPVAQRVFFLSIRVRSAAYLDLHHISTYAQSASKWNSNNGPAPTHASLATHSRRKASATGTRTWSRMIRILATSTVARIRAYTQISSSMNHGRLNANLC